jgi:AAA15 family ATPase/GTPase
MMKMIKKFEVTNYRGFKSKLTFDLSKTRDYEFNTDFIKKGIVNKGLIYGKNGTGKSNLGLALYDITSHLTDKQKTDIMYKGYYQNLDNKSKVSVFSYFFQFDNDEIQYNYGKYSLDTLVYEQVLLNGKEILWFSFSDGNMKDTKTRPNFIDIAGIDSLIIELPDNKLSALKYIYRNTPTNNESPITKIVRFSEGMLWFRCLNEGNRFIGFKSGGENLNDIILSQNKLIEFQKFLQQNGLEYNLVQKTIGDKNHIFSQFENGEGSLAELMSSGTSALWLFFCWSLSFEKVTFLYVDEFDAYYHYETAEMIINQINSVADVQAFVTSHNTYLMTNKTTRPDCCYIISDNQIRNLSDSTEKEIREAHNLEKMYRNGAFVQ